MAIIIGILLLLFGVGFTMVPSDHNLSAKLEEALRAQLHPAVVQVAMHRGCRLSTTVERLNITVNGFTIAPHAAIAEGAAAAPATAVPGMPASSPAPVLPSSAPAATAAWHAASTHGRQVRIKAVHVSCADFVVSDIPVYQATVEVSELKFPLSGLLHRAYMPSSVGAISGNVTLQQSGLTSYLRTLKLPLVDPEISITPDGCRVKGVTRGIIGVPVELSGRLAVRQDAVLFLENPKLHVIGLPLPEFAVKRLLRDIDPLVDINAELRLPVHVTITKTTHGDGLLLFDLLARMQ